MKILRLLLRLFVAPVYAFSVGCFFILFEIFSVFKKNKQPLLITDNEKKLDGVSFIIPTWNKKSLVLQCIKLLDACLVREARELPTEILVVENGSSDGTLAALQQLKTKTKLIVLASPQNLGFSKGINWGVKEAHFNYVYLLNNDMEVQPGFLKNIVKVAEGLLQNTAGFFGIASQIFFYDPSKRREESGKTYSALHLGFLQVAHYVIPAALQQTSLTLYPGGGSALINKKLFLSFGGYDHAAYVPLYCEDLDAGVVAWKSGWPSYFVPESHVIHHHQSSSKSLARPPEFFMHKNWLVVLLKNLDGWSEIMRHLFFFPLRILLSDEVCEYGIAALQRLPIIFQRKIFLTRFKTIHTGKKILNFATFEVTT